MARLAKNDTVIRRVRPFKLDMSDMMRSSS